MSTEDLEKKLDKEKSQQTYIDQQGNYQNGRFPTAAKLYNAWVKFSDALLERLGYSQKDKND